MHYSSSMACLDYLLPGWLGNVSADGGGCKSLAARAMGGYQRGSDFYMEA